MLKIARWRAPGKRRWQIKQAILKEPTANDSKVARQTKTDRETVAAVRSDMFNSAETRKNEHRPSERIAEVLKSEPKLSTRQAAKKARATAALKANPNASLSEPP